MTELETMLFKQFSTLSIAFEGQCAQQARGLTDCTQQLDAQAEVMTQLSRQVARLTALVNDLSAQLERDS